MENIKNKKNNQTCLHILVMSLNKLFQNIVFNDFMCSDEEYWIDINSSEKISSNDFIKIEKEIKRIVASGSKIEKIDKLANKNFVSSVMEKSHDNYIFIKIKDYESISEKEICENVNEVKFFKLTSIGGVFDNNKHSLRISGVAFNSKDEFEKWEKFDLDQKERDHRKLGKEMEIFILDNLVGQGLPIWLSNGQIIKNKIRDFLIDIFLMYNFDIVDTPILGNKELYVISGHWEHYKENNFPPIKVDDEFYMLRPMTCPHHIIIYNQKIHSYKSLPYKICENSKLFRYESSGGLIGLERVRSMELFDSHIFCEHKKINEVIFELNEILKIVYEKMNIKINRIDLSFHDPSNKEKYHDDEKMWKESENQLKNIAEKLNYKTVELIGEAAFYGPKIDFQVKTNLGKMITISTIQLDFLLPKKFDSFYIDKNNEKQIPVLIHFGVIGTYERFISILLSQTKGKIPFWMSPIQIIIIPINNELHIEYSKSIQKELLKNKIIAKIDNSEERLSKKIRNAQIKKIPFQIIIGDEEIKNNDISYREYQNEESKKLKMTHFIKLLNDLI